VILSILPWLLCATLAQQPPTPAAAPQPPADSGYVPQRVFDTIKKAFSDFEVMLVELAAADVVLVGEQHDDANTHRLERAVLEGLRRRGVLAVVSLEMFERDVQPTLDAYLAGRIDETAFLAEARPWPRYATDYRPLVEFAARERWPVIAANVPRKYAAAVAKAGLSALAELTPAERAMVARDLECPLDGYFERFRESMGGHPSDPSAVSDDERRATVERYYFAQCVKDETMAESIAAALGERGADRRGPIVHYNGAFHSDFGAGVAARVRRRLPASRVAIVSILPVADLDAVNPSAEDFSRATFLVYTTR
jgi:uncharacterized iron-regulated protein